MSNRCRKSTGGVVRCFDNIIETSNDLSVAGIKLNEFRDVSQSPQTQYENSSDTNDGPINQLTEEVDMPFNTDEAYATMDGGGRSLRRRTSKPDFKNFLEDFDPGNSEREVRKRKKKLAVNGKYTNILSSLPKDLGILQNFQPNKF